MTHPNIQTQYLQQVFQSLIQSGDYVGLFNAMYDQSEQNGLVLPWVHMKPHPLLVEWADRTNLEGKSALVVGSGLGDDAEELARRGFSVVGFDFSANAIAWCKKRFPISSVQYHEADLFELPSEWQHRFDFVLEVLTLPSIPRPKLAQAISHIASLVAPEGTLLTICFGSDSVQEGSIPLPLTYAELSQFQVHGLEEISFEDIVDQQRRVFRVAYRMRPL